MNEIDRLIFQMGVETREAFSRMNHATDKIKEIEVQAKRVGMKIDWDGQRLIPISEEKETVIKQLKQNAR
jgi:hypothetical protein